MSDDQWKFWCYVNGSPKVIGVQVSRTGDVDNLQDRVHTKLAGRLGDFAAWELTLYKPKCPIPASPADGLAARVQSVQSSDLEELDPALPLSTYFTDPPDKSLLHIIVERPPVHRSKRLKLESEDVLGKSIAERIAEQKIRYETPSDLAELHNASKFQDDQNYRIFNDRPRPDRGIAPIALLYDGFAEFQDIFAGQKEEPVNSDISKAAEFVRAVTAFCDEMSLYYKDEDRRRDAGLPLLDEIFHAYDGYTFQSIQPSAIGSVRSDGHSLCLTGGAADVVVEFKLEAGIADLQAISYLARLHSLATERNEDLYEGWRAPALIITIAGASITFYAVIFIGNYREVALTPALLVTNPGGEVEQRAAVIRAFKAAVVLRRKICQDTEEKLKLCKNKKLERLELKKLVLPDISSVASSVPNVPTARLEFGIEDQVNTVSFSSFIYYARTWGQRILIKCTRRYSRTLHELCAAHGHAPKLLGFEQVSGGWFVVAMEYVEGVSLYRKQVYHQKWRESLEQMVQIFHTEGLVHGDLRDANLFILDADETKAMILDFDWGGKEGEVHFPTPYLHWDLGVTGSRNLTIMIEDDDRTLKTALRKYQEVGHVTIDNPLPLEEHRSNNFM